MTELIKGAKLDDCPDIICKKCGFMDFLEGRRFKKMSSFVTKSGEEEVAVFQTHLCVNCGTPVDMKYDLKP